MTKDIGRIGDGDLSDLDRKRGDGPIPNRMNWSRNMQQSSCTTVSYFLVAELSLQTRSWSVDENTLWALLHLVSLVRT